MDNTYVEMWDLSNTGDASLYIDVLSLTSEGQTKVIRLDVHLCE